MKPRIIFKDNSTLQDLTVKVNNYLVSNDTLSIVATEDALFVGAYFPFNGLYFKMGTTVNDLASSMNILLWDGSDFNSVAEVIDETETSSKTLSQSGFVNFIPDKNHDWVRDDTQESNGDELVEDLGDVNIYDRYWIKITFSGDLTSNINLDWIGDLFVGSDEEIEALYPALGLSTTLDAFKSGKTDWEEQRVKASEIIINDLIKRNLIKSSGQILNREQFKLCCIHKVAEIIYYVFGDGHEDMRKKAIKYYNKHIPDFSAVVDENNNARSDDGERKSTTPHGFR